MTASLLPVKDRNDPCLVLSNGLKPGLRHVEVRPWRVAPPTIITRQGIVGRAKISGRNGDVGALNAPLRHLDRVTHYLITPSTSLAVVEQSRAKCCRLCAVTVCIQIPIPTCSTYTKQR